MRETIDPDDIARAVLTEFESWPQKRKPQQRSNGAKEWVPLSGIVIQRPNPPDPSLRGIADSRRRKRAAHMCRRSAHGITLHDWHAEILVLRAWNHFLLAECRAVAASPDGDAASAYVRRRHSTDVCAARPQPFALRDGLRLHMYCSEAPCGDASMELTMAAQEDATPWRAADTPPALSVLHGRSYFSHLGCIRRKPARPDAPPTRSKSCSDKLALKQFTSLLSAVASVLISPQDIYLSSLVLPRAQISERACTRAFHASGRLAPLLPHGQPPAWPGAYAFHAFSLRSTTLEFAFSRRQLLLPHERLVPSNLASFSTPHAAGTLIGGTLQGHKPFSPSGAACVCRSQLWQLALDIAHITGSASAEQLLRAPTYAHMKLGDLLSVRRRVKKDVRSILGGDAGEDAWVRNIGDEDFVLVN
ncbi:hypothetical protein K3495_g8429 [Podosphaera aphanis]|nr:hypothetical protein K3495_g8429 [Podosphaera aphanis]